MRTGIRIGKYDSAEVVEAKNAERKRLQEIYKATYGAQLKQLKAQERKRVRELKKRLINRGETNETQAPCVEKPPHAEPGKLKASDSAEQVGQPEQMRLEKP